MLLALEHCSERCESPIDACLKTQAQAVDKSEVVAVGILHLILTPLNGEKGR